MKRKINQQLLLIAGITMLVTLCSLIIVFYEMFQKQVMSDLRVFSYLLRNSVEQSGDLKIQEEYENVLRVTWMNKDGTVLLDTNANIDSMDNHLNRPEMVQAVEQGEGQAIRKSDTLSKNTFYYAVLLNDGSVIRLSREADSIWSVFQNACPIILLIIAGIGLLSVVIANIATKRLIKPIEQMAKDLDKNTVEPIYKELEPFVKMIRQQHTDILKNAHIRQEFTANVTHELKTPLTVITGYSELIQAGIVSPEDTIRFAGEINKNASRLLTLINDILRLSQLDSKDLQASREEVDLYQISQSVIELLKVNAEKQHVTLMLSGTPQIVMGDKGMLEELVYNLCDNAIRYNVKGGKVVIYIGASEEHAILSVKDTGIGIPEKHQKRIFERFYRVDKGRSKSTGGTGLGLAIVKHIVTWHRATLKLESEEGKGTEITVAFPETVSKKN